MTNEVSIRCQKTPEVGIWPTPVCVYYGSWNYAPKFWHLAVQLLVSFAKWTVSHIICTFCQKTVDATVVDGSYSVSTKIDVN